MRFLIICWMLLSKGRSALAVRERRKNSGCGFFAKNVICRVLCLCGGVNQKLTMIAKLLE